jgi:hypothetical protein
MTLWVATWLKSSSSKIRPLILDGVLLLRLLFCYATSKHDTWRTPFTEIQSYTLQTQLYHSITFVFTVLPFQQSITKLLQGVRSEYCSRHRHRSQNEYTCMLTSTNVTFITYEIFVQYCYEIKLVFLWLNESLFPFNFGNNRKTRAANATKSEENWKEQIHWEWYMVLVFGSVTRCDGTQVKQATGCQR